MTEEELEKNHSGLLLFLSGRGLNKKTALSWINLNGLEYFNEKVQVVSGMKDCKSFPAALNRALKEDWKLTKKKPIDNPETSITETKLTIAKIEEDTKLANQPENKTKGLKSIDQCLTTLKIAKT